MGCAYSLCAYIALENRFELKTIRPAGLVCDLISFHLRHAVFFFHTMQSDSTWIPYSLIRTEIELHNNVHLTYFYAAALHISLSLRSLFSVSLFSVSVFILHSFSAFPAEPMNLSRFLSLFRYAPLYVFCFLNRICTV